MFFAKQLVSLGVIGSLAKYPLFERLWQTSLWKTDELMHVLIELEGRCSSKAVLKNSKGPKCLMGSAWVS